MVKFIQIKMQLFLSVELGGKVDRGYRVTFLDVNQYGQVENDVMADAIEDQTVLVSLIWGNNEIGTLNNIDQLSKIANNKGALFHTDATQVIGKIPVDVKKTNIDFLSLSGHKFYAPKGVGAAYIKGDEYGLPPITSLLHGGSQEVGIRAGTLAVHNIIGLGKAAELMSEEVDEKIKKLKSLHEFIISEIAKLKYIEVLGPSTRLYSWNNKHSSSFRFIQ